jgi:hypothetical protein
MSNLTSADKAPEGSEQQLRQYNYEHFWLKHIVADLVRSAKGAGLRAGSAAPDFELRSTDGEDIRLSGLRGRPVLLHMGSGT